MKRKVELRNRLAAVASRSASPLRHLFRQSRTAVVSFFGILFFSSAVWAVFTNGGFETGTPGAAPPAPWTVQTFLNGAGITILPTQTEASLNLTAGGKPATLVVASATGPGTQVDPQLGPTASLRFPRYGKQAVIVNENSGSANPKNVNKLLQVVTIGAGDIDPQDNQVHIRFVIAPVLQNPSHTANQQPYYFVQVTNLTRGNAVLYSDFQVSGTAGVPWKSVNAGANEIDYTDWQLVDIAPGAPAINPGDQVQLEILAAGCQLGAHFGEVYVDGVGATVPGIYVEGTTPAAAQDGSNLTYTLNIQNGGSASATGVTLTFNTPPNTTYQSVAAPADATCTTPAAGATGAVVCKFASPLASGAAEPALYVTVNINTGTTGTITQGNYSVSSAQETALLGPHIVTNVNQPSFSIAKTHNGNFVQGDAADVFTISVANTGFGGSNGTLTITDTLPTAYTALGFASIPSGWNCSVTPVECTLAGSLPVGQTASFPLQVSVSPNATVGSGVAANTNTASISGGGAKSGQTTSDTPTILAQTATALGNLNNVNLSASAQSLPVSATVAAPNYAGNTVVSSGSVTFTIRDSQNNVAGTAAGPVVSGTASVNVTIPALQAPGSYSITASYAAAGLYNGSTSTAKTFSISDVISTLTATSGNAQSTTVSTQFVAPLTASVRDAANNPIANIAVVFAAPQTGASGTFSNGLTTITAQTDASGLASAALVANATAGSYSVSASAGAQATAFSLTNTAVATNVTVAAASATYSSAQQTVTLSATVSSASGSINAGTVTFTVPGVGTAISGTVANGMASATLTIPATQAVGPYTINAAYSGAGSFAGSNGTQILTIGLATQTIAFGAIAAQTVHAPLMVSASASSGLTVSFASATPSICSVSNTTVSLTTAGTCTITATQAGNAQYSAAAPVSQSFTVNLTDQTITFPSLASPVVYGSGPYALGATASSGLSVSYSVTGPATLAGATLSITGAGSVVVAASQAGNTTYSAATPVAQTIKVNQATSATVLSAASATPSQGQADLLTATVTGGGQLGGTVVFTAGATTLCTASLNAAGTATCSYTPAAPGTVSIVAQYQGDANHVSSSAMLALNVGSSYDSAISLKVSNTQLVYPGATNVTVCLTPSTATGTVQIFDGTTKLTTQPVQGGGCAYWYISPGLNAGTHVLTALYSGDAKNAAGTSAPVTLNVAPVPVNMGVSCWNASFPYGADYQCTISLSSNAGSAQGSLTYTYDGNAAQTLPINNGNVQFTITKPVVGNHKVVVAYAQQTNYAAAPANTQTFTVTQAPVNVALTPSTWYTNAGTNITFQVAVTSWSTGAPNANGSVQFYDGQTLLSTVPVNASGQASFTAANLAVGSHNITATYSGGTNYASGSGSAAITIAP
jgi:uncharacterized repeat protein (TIGR01451 family)